MRIVWAPLAVSDREAIFDYIEKDKPRAAVRVDDAIETQVEMLAGSPEMGREGRVVGTRELVIERTPYIVAYTIERNCVKIQRVLHGAQRWPGEF